MSPTHLLTPSRHNHVHRPHVGKQSIRARVLWFSEKELPRAHWRKSRGRHLYARVEARSEVMGHVSARMNPGRSSISIHVLWVEKVWRRWGVGSFLMKSLFEEFSPARYRYELSVEPLGDKSGPNTRQLVLFYSKFGFRRVANFGGGLCMERPKDSR